MNDFPEKFYPLEIEVLPGGIQLQQYSVPDLDVDMILIGHCQIDSVIESLKRAKARYERQVAKCAIEDLKKQLDDDNEKRFPHLVDGEGPEAA